LSQFTNGIPKHPYEALHVKRDASLDRRNCFKEQVYSTRSMRKIEIVAHLDTIGVNENLIGGLVKGDEL